MTGESSLTKKDEPFLERWRRKPVLLIILFILFVVMIGLYISVDFENPKLIMLPIIGAASFAIPLLLSFDDKYNLGTRLDNGEVRKSIAISLTMVYIIMLCLFFANYLPYLGPQNNSPNVTSSLGDKNNSSNGNVEDAANFGLILPLLVQPATAQSSTNEMEGSGTEAKGNAENNDPPDEASPQEESTSGSEDVDDTPKNDTEEEAQSNDLPEVPSEALTSIYKNFLYVYVIIIGFYFGSRVFEDFAGVRMFKELKDFVPEDLLKKRYAMGEISQEDYKIRINDLEKSMGLDFFLDRDAKQLRIANSSDKAVTIKETYIDGIPIYKKDVQIDAKAFSDIDIEIKDLVEKDIYSIKSITGSGEVIIGNASKMKIK